VSVRASTLTHLPETGSSTARWDKMLRPSSPEVKKRRSFHLRHPAPKPFLAACLQALLILVSTQTSLGTGPRGTVLFLQRKPVAAHQDPRGDMSRHVM